MANEAGRLAGRTALVTGGSSGIGAACVRRLADAGARVAVGFHSGEDRAREIVGALPGEGHRVVRISLEDTAGIYRAADELKAGWDRLDVLVNSAGWTRPIPHADLDTLDDELFGQILLANARGPYSVVRATLPLLEASGDAVVVNVSSVSAFTGAGSNIAYCAAKAALDTTGMALARVLGPGIRVLSVSPAAVATDFVAGRGRDALEKLAATTPLKRVVEADDVADAVMACITHLRAATGIRIVVDGGRTL